MSEKYYKTKVHGLFWGQEVIAKPLIEGMLKFGYSYKEIFLAWTNPKVRAEIITHFAVSLKISLSSLEHDYESITVKTNFGCTFAECVSLGQYRKIGLNVNERDFPVNRPVDLSQRLLTASGPYRSSDGTVKIVLVNMHGEVRSDEVLECMVKENLRPIDAQHLFAVGEYFANFDKQNSNAQRQFKVVALASSPVRFGGGGQVLGVGGSGSERYLETFWYATLWSEHTRFGAIAEEVP